MSSSVISCHLICHIVSSCVLPYHTFVCPFGSLCVRLFPRVPSYAVSCHHGPLLSNCIIYPLETSSILSCRLLSSRGVFFCHRVSSTVCSCLFFCPLVFSVEPLSLSQLTSPFCAAVNYNNHQNNNNNNSRFASGRVVLDLFARPSTHNNNHQNNNYNVNDNNNSRFASGRDVLGHRQLQQSPKQQQRKQQQLTFSLFAQPSTTTITK